jgi:peptide deformylase
MAVLPLLQIRPGNPDSSTDILRTPARQVTDFSPTLQGRAADLLDTLRHHGAAGIAAPQAGIPLRLAVVEQERGRPLVLVNPRITAEAKTVSEGLEACLSLPGICCVVKRPGALEMAFQDPAGVRHILEVQGPLARIIAHEVDHLEGVLCTGRAVHAMTGGEP